MRDIDDKLIEAAGQGNLKAVKAYIKLGADIHAGHGEALSFAANTREIVVVRWLLIQGADVNANNGEALRLASSNGDMEIIKLLLEYGAEVDQVMWNNATYNGHYRVAKFLKSFL